VATDGVRSRVCGVQKIVADIMCIQQNKHWSRYFVVFSLVVPPKTGARPWKYYCMFHGSSNGRQGNWIARKLGFTICIIFPWGLMCAYAHVCILFRCVCVCVWGVETNSRKDKRQLSLQRRTVIIWTINRSSLRILFKERFRARRAKSDTATTAYPARISRARSRGMWRNSEG